MNCETILILCAFVTTLNGDLLIFNFGEVLKNLRKMEKQNKGVATNNGNDNGQSSSQIKRSRSIGSSIRILPTIPPKKTRKKKTISISFGEHVLKDTPRLESKEPHYLDDKATFSNSLTRARMSGFCRETTKDTETHPKKIEGIAPLVNIFTTEVTTLPTELDSVKSIPMHSTIQDAIEPYTSTMFRETIRRSPSSVNLRPFYNYYSNISTEKFETQTFPVDKILTAGSFNISSPYEIQSVLPDFSRRHLELTEFETIDGIWTISKSVPIVTFRRDGVYLTDCLQLKGQISINIEYQTIDGTKAASIINVPEVADSVTGLCTKQTHINGSMHIKWDGLYTLSLYFDGNSYRWYLSSFSLEIKTSTNERFENAVEDVIIRKSAQGKWYATPHNYSVHCLQRTSIVFRHGALILENLRIEPLAMNNGIHSNTSTCLQQKVRIFQRKLVPILIIAFLPLVTLLCILGLAFILRREQRLEREALLEELEDAQTE